MGKIILYTLTIAIAVAASLTAGLLIFWSYALDEPCIMVLALLVIIGIIPICAAADNLEKKL